MATIAPPAPTGATTTGFPNAAVAQCLHDELVAAVTAMAGIKNIPLPSNPSQIPTMPVQVDSLVCVDILCAVEPLLGGIELPESVVKTGGYGSIDSAIRNMIPRIEKEWKKLKGAKP
jgi:hypothetical protein